MYLSAPNELPIYAQRELDALRNLHAVNIIGLIGSHQQAFTVSVILEDCYTDLWRVLASQKDVLLPLSVVKAIAYQLLSALDVCHENGFMHRDVAPSNILFNHGGVVKLADFGQSRRADSHAHGGEESPCMTPSVGTRWYRSPELLLGSKLHTPAMDIWSAGCILAELINGEPLFPGNSDIDMLCRLNVLLGTIHPESDWADVVNLPDWGKLMFPEADPKPIATWLKAPPSDPYALDLVSGMLRYDPSKRPLAAAALRSPFFTTGCHMASSDEISKLLLELTSL